MWRDGKFIIVDSRDESIREYAMDVHGVPLTASESEGDGLPPHHRLVSQTATKHAHVPDGMALDDRGNLWVAVGESGVVRCLDGMTGEAIREVKVGVNRPTSCNFGGKGLDVLYVTSRVEKAGPDQSASHGGVFAVTGLGVKGAAFDGKFRLSEVNS